MKQYLKMGISALAVSALFLAPAATVTFITADAAYANNGTGNGGGNGGGNRGGGKGGGAGKGGDKGGDKGARGNGNKGNKGAKNKSAKTGGFGKGLSDFGNSFKKDVGKLFGVKPKKKATAKASKPAKSSQVAKSSLGKPEQGIMHPSNLGKMNGVINSSPNAKLAHIANGQYMKGTGPVSLAAALTVADYQYAKALDDFDMAVETLDAATEDQLMAAQTIFADYDANMDGFLSEEERDTAIEATAETDAPLSEDDLDAAQTISDAQETVAAGEPSADAVKEAQDAVLSTYKGDLPTLMPDEEAVVDAVATEETEEDVVDEIPAYYEGYSPEEIEVLDNVRTSLPQDDADIQAALDKYDEKSMNGEEDSEYGDDGEMTEDGTDSAMIDETEPSEG